MTGDQKKVNGSTVPNEWNPATYETYNKNEHFCPADELALAWFMTHIYAKDLCAFELGVLRIWSSSKYY